ncbi:hypothetical protein NQ314_006774 [Rhamnusium bicolor]|uniref:AH domain-containing protein n=1 Tax=Rhamnusium bicolor TaxID=1586634 RepID=A0AAV8YX99_9CUCU|nr:hypothetical protein NQ314_006774 [Rhamnusium bicolor]
MDPADEKLIEFEQVNDTKNQLVVPEKEKDSTLNSPELEVLLFDMCPVERSQRENTLYDEVIINYNKLHADPKQGKSLDIVLKKMKHRLVENMSSSTADALGLSRAILCNDTLVKKMQELQDTELMYRGLAHVDLHQSIKGMGDVFASIAVREPQPRASEAFRLFGEQHRNMEKIGQDMIKMLNP